MLTASEASEATNPNDPLATNNEHRQTPNKLFGLIVINRHKDWPGKKQCRHPRVFIPARQSAAAPPKTDGYGPDSCPAKPSFILSFPFPTPRHLHHHVGRRKLILFWREVRESAVALSAVAHPLPFIYAFLAKQIFQDTSSNFLESEDRAWPGGGREGAARASGRTVGEGEGGLVFLKPFRTGEHESTG